MSFLLLSPAAFQEVPDPVVNEEFPQSSFNFPLFILVDLCYACHGKSLLWYVVWWCLHYTIFSGLLPLFFNAFSNFCLVSVEFSRSDPHYSCGKCELVTCRANINHTSRRWRLELKQSIQRRNPLPNQPIENTAHMW